MENPRPNAVRLLVIDDDEAVRELLRVIFLRNGIACDFVSDGQQGLDRLSRGTYDVILLDLMLPVTNGFEVIQQLKAGERQFLARTIVLTAASDHTLRTFDDASLVRRVMHKPFDINDLVGEVRSCGAAAAAEHVH